MFVVNHAMDMRTYISKQQTLSGQVIITLPKVEQGSLDNLSAYA